MIWLITNETIKRSGRVQEKFLVKMAKWFWYATVALTSKFIPADYQKWNKVQNIANNQYLMTSVMVKDTLFKRIKIKSHLEILMRTMTMIQKYRVILMKLRDKLMIPTPYRMIQMKMKDKLVILIPCKKILKMVSMEFFGLKTLQMLVQVIKCQQESVKCRKVGTKVRHLPSDHTLWKEAEILSRAGKVTGKYKN